MENLLETKEHLTNLRAAEAKQVFGKSVYTELEKTYGKYLFVPFDVPKIVPNNLEKFIDFYYANASYAEKIRGDLMEEPGPDDKKPANKTPYLTLDGQGETKNSVWSKNPVPAIFDEFPEIFDQLHTYFPFINRGFMWTMWSSTKNILTHRDMRSMLDMPIRLRVKLFDSNPVETLKLTLAPINKPDVETYTLPVPEDTNCFAWNNLRTRHESTYTPGFRKILLISFSNYKGPAMNRYVDLLEKSISKYKDNVIVDTKTTVEDYINL